MQGGVDHQHEPRRAAESGTDPDVLAAGEEFRFEANNREEIYGCITRALAGAGVWPAEAGGQGAFEERSCPRRGTQSPHPEGPLPAASEAAPDGGDPPLPRRTHRAPAGLVRHERRGDRGRRRVRSRDVVQNKITHRQLARCRNLHCTQLRPHLPRSCLYFSVWAVHGATGSSRRERRGCKIQCCHATTADRH